MSLDPKLLEILACPEDKGPLLYFEDENLLYNPRLQRKYRIDDDIPVISWTRPRRPMTPSTSASWRRPMPSASSPRSLMNDRRSRSAGRTGRQGEEPSGAEP